LPPRYHDKNDLRFVQIIKARKHRARGAVNILGAPFDGAVLGRKGAAEGPAGLRKALSAFSNYNVELGIGLKGAEIIDLGDLVLGEEVARAHGEIRRNAREELDETSLLVLLGGDNSVSLPGIQALADRFRKIGLVAVDSHFDLRGKIGGRPTSGSSYGLAVETVSGLEPRRVVEMGIHGFLNSASYAKKAEELGITVITADAIRRRGAKEVARDAYRTASRGADAVYFSVDLDAVDSAEVSGVSAPSAGGIGAKELFDLAYYFGGRPLVSGADIVELAPSLDPTGRSQVVGATALVYLCAGFLRRTAT
jgi:formiminoglutamase